MKVRFVVNPIAGGRSRVEEVSGAIKNVFLSERGIFELRVTEKAGEARELSAEARRRGYDAVFACGGDGTINEVASELVGSEMVLGIIPSGSGNGLARALAIPTGVESAVRLALGGGVRRIDVGVVNKRYFFSTAGFGFEALVSKRYSERPARARRRGILPYLPIVVREFIWYNPDALVVKMNGKLMRIVPFIFTAANTREFGASAVIAPGAVPDDGLLDVCVIEDLGVFDALLYAYRLFSGTIDRARKFKCRRAASFEITRKNPGVVHLDGEPFEVGEKIKVELLPKALKVFVG